MSADKRWRAGVRWVFERLAENERRWVAVLLSTAVGWSAEAFAAAVTGLDPKTVRAGRAELKSALDDCPPAGGKKHPAIEADRGTGHGGDATGKRAYIRSSPRSLPETSVTGASALC